MKLRFALLLCLIALFNCNCDVKETITCLLSNKKVLDIGIKLIRLIFQKEFQQIIPTIIESLPELKTAFLECKEKQSEDAEIILKGGPECRDWWGYFWCCLSAPASCQACYVSNCK